MNLDEWKALVLRNYPEALFRDLDDGSSSAVVGAGLTIECVGTYTVDGVVWFKGRKRPDVGAVESQVA